MTRTLSLYGLMASSILWGTGPALAVPSPFRATAPAAQAWVSGAVTNPQGQPLAGVLIIQQGGVDASLTQAGGTYRLRLDPGGGQQLTFSAVGYLSQRVPLSQADRVTMQPVPTYQPAFTPLPPEAAVGPAHPFDTSIGLAYRLRDLSMNSRSYGVSGWADNELYAQARYRFHDAVLGLDGYSNKVPFAFEGLMTQPSPAPEAQQTRWMITLGYALDLPGVELLPEVLYATDYVANTSGVPWTGTPLDFNQTRQGFGLGLEAGTRQGSWELLARGQWVPSYDTSVSSAPYPISNVEGFEWGATLGYDLVPALRLDLSADRQSAVGTNLEERDTVVGLGLSYHPQRLLP